MMNVPLFMNEEEGSIGTKRGLPYIDEKKKKGNVK